MITFLSHTLHQSKVGNLREFQDFWIKKVEDRKKLSGKF